MVEGGREGECVSVGCCCRGCGVVAHLAVDARAMNTFIFFARLGLDANAPNPNAVPCEKPT